METANDQASAINATTALTRVLVAQMQQANADNDTVNLKYQRWYKECCQYVDGNPDLSKMRTEIYNDKYIFQDALDSFYVKIIAKKPVTASYVRSCMNALEKYGSLGNADADINVREINQ